MINDNDNDIDHNSNSNDNNKIYGLYPLVEIRSFTQMSNENNIKMMVMIAINALNVGIISNYLCIPSVIRQLLGSYNDPL